MPTAPKWAQTIGLTTRNQALRFQAINVMGYDSRAQFERYRKWIVNTSPEAAALWRKHLAANTRAEALQERQRRGAYSKEFGREVQKAISESQATRDDLNRRLPEHLRQHSPKVGRSYRL